MNTKMLIVLGMFTVSVGCQNAAEISTDLTNDVAQGTATSCTPGSQKLVKEDLQIIGVATAQKGQATHYELNQSVACDSSEQVVWKVNSAEGQEIVANSLESIYKKPGRYIVTAKIADVAADASKESRKAMALSATAAGGVDTLATQTFVVSDTIVLVAPQVIEVNQVFTAQMGIPADTEIYEAIYDFGDGSPRVSSLSPVQHSYSATGTYTIKVSLEGNNGAEGSWSQSIQVIEPQEPVCTQVAAISGATEVEVDQRLDLSVYMSACIAAQVGEIKWDMGDGVLYDSKGVGHTYKAVGNYEVTAVLHKASDGAVLFTLKHPVEVKEGAGENPTNPNACTIQNQTRDSKSAQYTERQACGLDGTKEIIYQDTIKEQCQMVAGQLQWNETARSKELVSEGTCLGQSCSLPDGSKLTDGLSKVFYSSQTPAGACADVKETRVCTNGVLGGSATHTQTTCSNGCVGFGSHGTVKTDVVTGEVTVPKVCKFGETGIVDIFNQTSTQTCVDGSVQNSNTQQAGIKTAGICPSYTLAPTDEYTTCSADCGGTQTKIFKCVDSAGLITDRARCEQQTHPVESRLCDGNPNAVKRDETKVTSEEANSSNTCPANQIGVVVNKRDVTTTESYACIDHKVQLANTVVTHGAWVAQSYCRDYVAHRCNHDSLSNNEANGRYNWMVKCQNQLPIVKEFLTEFEDVKGGKGKHAPTIGLTAKGQTLYASFMNRAFSPEKPWIAPKTANAECVMPATAYIATVCVSSCATPEQLILAQDVASGKMKYVPFIEALTQKTAFVASLQSAQSMGSKAVTKTKVDQWVTELVDSEHEILIFKMKTGREIKVTTNHPLVDAKGYMRTANEFQAGDSLVQLGGALDQIVSITPVKHTGKVYNVFVQSAAVHNNILVLNGYLNGSAFFQNEGASHMNKTLLRKSLIRGVF